MFALTGVEDTGRYAAIRKSKRMQEKLEGKKEESEDEDEEGEHLNQSSLLSRGALVP